MSAPLDLLALLFCFLVTGKKTTRIKKFKISNMLFELEMFSLNKCAYRSKVLKSSVS